MEAHDRDRVRAVPYMVGQLVRDGLDPPLAVLAVVERFWGRNPEAARRELAHALLIAVDPIVRGGSVTEEAREACEAALLDWHAVHGDR